MGSNIASTDDNQNVLARYEYDVFGAIRSETGTSDNTRKFTGKEFDADSNLYYYGARYYDPYIGRFTQRDSIADGVNWYAYTLMANIPIFTVVDSDPFVFTEASLDMEMRVSAHNEESTNLKTNKLEKLLLQNMFQS